MKVKTIRGTVIAIYNCKAPSWNISPVTSGFTGNLMISVLIRVFIFDAMSAWCLENCWPLNGESLPGENLD